MAEQLGANYYNTPYKFNGKELDVETGLYYYGARYYDPKTSIWLSVDPLAEKYPNMSPYAYCFNNPVIFTDPDGRDPIITITNQVVGSTYVKLVGADNRGGYGNYVTIKVPLYRAIITDDEDSDFRMETMVTRDSWKVNNVEGNVASVSNLAFEPADGGNNEYDGVYNAPYPHGNDTAGYALTQDGSRTLESEPRSNVNGETVNSATDVMIHVGATYQNEKDDTYGGKTRTRAGGSLACFGVVNKGNSANNTSDKETKRVVGGVRNQSDKDSWFGHSNVKIIIQKRQNVERTKQVVLPNQ
jgi:RHS repeat-associated protein